MEQCKTENTTDYIPHAAQYHTKYVFESGEPPETENAEDPEVPDNSSQWNSESRTIWQMHSEAGPNLNPSVLQRPLEPLPDVVNPPTCNWKSIEGAVPSYRVKQYWESLRNSTSVSSNKTLSSHTLND